MHELTARQPKRVLVIEDDYDTARMIQLWLEWEETAEKGTTHQACCVHGTWIVTTASTLSTGVDLLHHNEYDLILLDLTLPDVAGEGVVNIVREAVPDVPVVVHSGASEVEVVRRLLLGDLVSDYIVKGDITNGYALKQRLCHAIDRFHVIRDVKNLQAANGY